MGELGASARAKKAAGLELSHPQSMPMDLILDALDVEVRRMQL
jgi:hypothetical protein